MKKLFSFIVLLFFVFNISFASSVEEIKSNYAGMYSELEESFEWYEDDEELREEYEYEKSLLDAAYKKELKQFNNIDQEEKNIVYSEKVEVLVANKEGFYYNKYKRKLSKLLPNLSASKLNSINKSLTKLEKKYKKVKLSPSKQADMLSKISALKNIFEWEYKKRLGINP